MGRRYLSLITVSAEPAVVYAAHAGNNTILSYYEPLVVYEGDNGFRPFASSTIVGLASELSFFRQTVAVVTEKAFIIAEPGNSTYNQIPTFPPDLHAPMMRRMMDGAKPLAMYQTSENEFLLVYQWGACFVTKCEWLQIPLRARDSSPR